MVWLGVFLGLNVLTVEAARGHLHRDVPAYVHLDGVRAVAALPTFLQPIAEWNPTSTLTNSLRELWGNPNPSGGTSLATTDPILVTLGVGGDLRRRVRTAERPEVPLDQPLADVVPLATRPTISGCSPTPALLAVGLLTSRSPAGRLYMVHSSSGPSRHSYSLPGGPRRRRRRADPVPCWWPGRAQPCLYRRGRGKPDKPGSISGR